MKRILPIDLNFPEDQLRVQEAYTHWVDDFVSTWTQPKPALRPLVTMHVIEALLEGHDTSLQFVPNLHNGQMWPLFGHIAVLQKRFNLRFSTYAARLLCELSLNIGTLEMFVVTIKHIEVGCCADRLVTTDVLKQGYFNEGYPSREDMERMWDAAKTSDGTTFFSQIDLSQMLPGVKDGG